MTWNDRQQGWLGRPPRPSESQQAEQMIRLSAAAQALPEKPSFTLVESAYYIGIHATTLRRWIVEDQVIARRTPGGHFRIDRPELQRILSQT